MTIYVGEFNAASCRPSGRMQTDYSAEPGAVDVVDSAEIKHDLTALRYFFFDNLTQLR